MASLAGKTVVITRPEEQSEALSARLRAEGARVVSAPAIAIEALIPDEAGRGMLSRLQQGDYAWVLFSSANGPRHFAHLIKPGSFPASVRIAAQGDATAKAVFKALGRPADFVPEVSVSDNFALEFAAASNGPVNVLLVGARETRGKLSSGLKAQGFGVDTLPIYQTQPSPIRPDVLSEISSVSPDELIVVFYSPSALRSFCEQVYKAGAQAILLRAQIAAIGPVTAQAAAELGLKISVEARSQSDESLIEALASMAD